MLNKPTPFKQFSVLSTLVLAAMFSRLIPHPPNFAPITAVAVFAGFYFSNIWLAILVPMISMFASDALIGFHPGMSVVYGCFALMSWSAHAASSKKSFGRIAGTLLGSNLFFFLVTNFAAWAGNPLYAQDFSGLMMSYTMAIPFYGSSIAGDVFYSAVIFGAWSIASKTVLAPSRTAA